MAAVEWDGGIYKADHISAHLTLSGRAFVTYANVPNVRADGAGGFRTPVPVESVQRAGVFVHPRGGRVALAPGS